MDVRRLLAHDAWANGETLTSLERATPAPPPAVRVMNHVLATEAGWLQRLGHPAPFDGFWPGEGVAALRAVQRGDLPARWASFLADPRLSDPKRTIEYVNSKGERWTNSVEDVLLHVFLHSAYHRGQVATHVRAAGGEPAQTDYVHAARTGVVG